MTGHWNQYSRGIIGLPSLFVAAGWLGWSFVSGPRANLLTPDWFRGMLRRLEFADQRLLPSWWLSSGLLEATRGVWSECVLFLALMIANALFFRQLAVWIAGRVYREAYGALAARGSSPKRWR